MEIISVSSANWLKCPSLCLNERSKKKAAVVEECKEYAQNAGLPTPVYETIMDGPSHEPCFRSTVIVNEVRYDSLPGFFNRKAAEQSAAEVALMELAKSGEVNHSITQPVHETGLCKNLLQEYAQKKNYAMPMYQCKKR
ncbi:hypothetical protein RYX36_006332 [Vicia faba]